MNTKRFLIIIGIISFSIVSIAPQSWAGSVAKHRIEGAVIGIGAIILGKALLDHSRHDQPEVRAVAVSRHRPRRHHRSTGYWGMHKEWVPPVYEKVWNPGHYSRRGHWVRGHWTRIRAEPGYWHTERVWVPYH